MYYIYISISRPDIIFIYFQFYKNQLPVNTQYNIVPNIHTLKKYYILSYLSILEILYSKSNSFEFTQSTEEEVQVINNKVFSIIFLFQMSCESVLAITHIFWHL